ncbi:S1 family serine peptidase [Nocardioides speluncae]|uniref:S1 family serine peptidase n=1 Tax=Nocardioides speluncae TaxID=2670337 RepID=UPI000D69B734|nr:serine protease [Nocardioides speluncae]
MRKLLLAAAILSLVAALGPAPASGIVGGYQAKSGQFPFMASIQTKGKPGTEGHFCGGSVIAKRWVLTAAHCMVDTKPRDIQVAVGRTNIDRRTTGQTLLVDRIVVHPSYASTGTYDAALIHVKADIKSPPIGLVPATNNSLERGGAALTVAGWGTEFFMSQTIPAHLKAVDVRAVADQSCVTNGLVGFKPGSEMCAEALLGDSCQGDSGGPLFGRLANGRRVQVGIVSYGLGCAVPLFPGVYAEVNNRSIHGFITRTIR